MSRKTLLIAVGILTAAGGAAAIAAVGHKAFRMGGHHGGPMMLGDVGIEGFGRMGGPPVRRLKRLDADKDGAVTIEEMLSPRKEVFDRLDANKDGALEAAEIGAQAKERMERWVQRLTRRLDGDRDGRITKEEFRRGPRGRFEARDRNGDGEITRDDLPPRMRARLAEREAAMAEKGEKGETRGEGRRGRWSLDRLLGRVDAEFARLDSNGDGMIDAAEVAAATTANVDYATKRALRRFDENRDGKVTLAEFNRFGAQRFADLDLDGDGRITDADLPPIMRGRGILR